MEQNIQPESSQISIFEMGKTVKHTETAEELTPKPFQYLYYAGNIEKCDDGSKNSFRWKSLLTYAMLVKDFYTALSIEFNRTLENPIELPDYMKNRHSLSSIDEIAQKLNEQEKRLFVTFDKDPSKVVAKCEKHQTLKRLREYAAMSWMLYHNLKRENYYHMIVDYKSQIENLDLTKDEDIANLFMFHMKTKNFVETKVQGYFSVNGFRRPFASMHPQTYGLYYGVQAEPLFDELIATFDGYNFKENKTKFPALLTDVQDEHAKMVINLYKKYSDIKYVYKKLFYISNQLKEYPETSCPFVDIDNNNRDLFVASTEYFTQVNDVLNMIETDSRFNYVYEDAIFILEKLAEAISLTNVEYDRIQKRKEEAIKHFPYNQQDLTT